MEENSCPDTSPENSGEPLHIEAEEQSQQADTAAQEGRSSLRIEKSHVPENGPVLAPENLIPEQELKGGVQARAVTECKVTSSRKAEANRRNAVKSAGPRTKKGKGNVRFNALKHGFFCKQVVLSARLIGEDKREFEELVAALWKDCQPVGRVEELLVDEMAVCCWRARRILRYELSDPALRNGSQPATYGGQENAGANASSSPIDRTNQLKIAANLWLWAKEEILQNGGLAHNSCVLMEFFFKENVDAVVKPRDSNRDIDEWKQETLARIDKRIEEIYTQLRDGSHAAQMHGAALARERASMPPFPVLDSIVRYWSANQRCFDRAFAQLERLQRRRLGEHVPAPLEVSITGHE